MAAVNHEDGPRVRRYVEGDSTRRTLHLRNGGPYRASNSNPGRRKNLPREPSKQVRRQQVELLGPSRCQLVEQG